MLRNTSSQPQKSNTESSGLQRICAWCGHVKVKEIWEVRIPIEGRPLTHGLCPDCYSAMIDKLQRGK